MGEQVGPVQKKHRNDAYPEHSLFSQAETQAQSTSACDQRANGIDVERCNGEAANKRQRIPCQRPQDITAKRGDDGPGGAAGSTRASGQFMEPAHWPGQSDP